MRKSFLTLAIGLFCLPAARAQFIEDGLRLALPNGVIAARSGALGKAYSGISDDFAALYYNPAGLTLLPKAELNVGLQLHRNTNTTFTPFSATFQSNSEAFNAIGIASPLVFGKTNAAIAVGYALESDFDDHYKAVGRGSSSIVNAWMASPSERDIAYQLFLADSINGKLVTPIHGGMTQNATVLESGGLHSLSGGMAFDITPTVAMGVTISGKWGTYSYDRRYTETDDNNIYNVLDRENFTNVDLASLSVRETLDQEIAGIGVTLGIQARVDELLRFGVTIKTPSYYSISETFSQKHTATFDNGDTYSSPSDGLEDRGKNSYSVTTPFVFGSGLSIHFEGVTLAGAVEYRDASQIEFTSSLLSIEELNIEARERLRSQLTLGGGIEYEPDFLPMAFRVGISSTESPYSNASGGDATTIASVGMGIYLAPTMRLDAMYAAHETYYQRALYNLADAQFDGRQRNSHIALQFIYRF